MSHYIAVGRRRLSCSNAFRVFAGTPAGPLSWRVIGAERLVCERWAAALLPGRDGNVRTGCIGGIAQPRTWAGAATCTTYVRVMAEGRGPVSGVGTGMCVLELGMVPAEGARHDAGGGEGPRG